ncbi:hypothetical protein BASA83_013610 [Batrachochytrium salamandrivorans]|nr:hypothetical protein BASA83_013610 [Batrachochytrium salamandrivorans]
MWPPYRPTVKATILPVEHHWRQQQQKQQINSYTPSSHPSSPISPSSPLSIYSDISSTSSYHPSSPLSTNSSIYIPSSPLPQPALFLTPAAPPKTQLTHPIQLHGIDLPSVSQYEYLGVIIDDLLNLSPWLVKKKRAITAAVHSISPLLRNNFLSTRITTTSTTPTISEIRHQRSKYELETYIPSLGQVQIGLQLCAGNHASSAKFLRSPALSTGQANRSLSPLTGPLCGLWDYPRALKAGLLHPTATTPTSWAVPACVYSANSHLDCKPMAHLVVDCTHPTVFFARVDTQLLQAINDTRVQIFDCTLHTTTTTTTTTTTPASPSLSTTSSNSNQIQLAPQSYGIV